MRAVLLSDGYPIRGEEVNFSFGDRLAVHSAKSLRAKQMKHFLIEKRHQADQPAPPPKNRFLRMITPKEKIGLYLSVDKAADQKLRFHEHRETPCEPEFTSKPGLPPPSELIHRPQKNESGDGVIPQLRLAVGGSRRRVPLALAGAAQPCKRIPVIRQECGP